MKPVNRMKKTVKKTATTATASPAPKASPVKTSTVTAAAPKAVRAATIAKPSSPPKSAAATAIPTTIEAKVDVGFGNSLFVRGEGAGLSWEHGTPLTNVDAQTWRLTVPAADKLHVKLLINDSIWAQGEDVVITPGKSVQLSPSF